MTESTMENPLNFFLKIFYDETFYERLKADFFSTYENAPKIIKQDMDINTIEEYYTHTFDYDEYNRAIPTKVLFSDELKRTFSDNCRNSKKLIKKQIGNLIKRNEPVPPFIQEQIRILKMITDTESEFFLKYPNTESIIHSLLDRLNLLLINYDDRRIELGHIITDSEGIIPKVNQILGYLKENNGNGQKIMTDSEHERLINLTIEMLVKEEVPIIDRKFSRLQITSGLLSFSFYVLHVELYGKKPRRPYFTTFLKDAFVQLGNNTYDTLSAKFSVPYGKGEVGPWIPDIIKQYKPR